MYEIESWGVKRKISGTEVFVFFLNIRVLRVQESSLTLDNESRFQVKEK